MSHCTLKRPFFDVRRFNPQTCVFFAVSPKNPPDRAREVRTPSRRIRVQFPIRCVSGAVQKGITASPCTIGRCRPGRAKFACSTASVRCVAAVPCQSPVVPTKNLKKINLPKVAPISIPEHGWTVLECIHASPREIGPRRPVPAKLGPESAYTQGGRKSDFLALAKFPLYRPKVSKK